MKKSQLKRRWKDEDFIQGLSFPLDRLPSEIELQGADIRGAVKLGLDFPLHLFQLYQVSTSNVDFTYSDGALGIRQSVLSSCSFDEFKFDRASSFYNSSFTKCSFLSCRLRADISDCTFTDCNFDSSKFAGGSSEYGFTRCVFENCSFSEAEWKGTFFKACKFIDCDLKGFKVSKSLVTAISHVGCSGDIEEVFVGSEVRRISVLNRD